jgi:hypothetical protein
VTYPPQPPQQPYAPPPAEHQQPSAVPQQQPYGPPPGGYAPGYPPVKPGTNGFAIASLVLGVVGGVLLSVVFGFVGLAQTRRTGQAGRGLALAGLALSAGWVVAGAIAVAVVLVTATDRNPTGQGTGKGSVSAFDLAVGDCLNGLKAGSNLSSLPRVPCTEPHEGEVFAVFDLPAGAYPGESRLADQARRQCADRFEGYAPSAVDDTSIELFFLHPTQLSWAQGDHEVTCVATDPNRKRTGSLKG